jgi:hypothetical protein
VVLVGAASAGELVGVSRVDRLTVGADAEELVGVPRTVHIGSGQNSTEEA